MPIFTVNSLLCRKDGICASVCPANIIEGPTGKIPVLREKGASRCLGCGQCVSFCPANAVSLEGLPMGTAIPIKKDLLPTAEQTAMLLKSRRSIRVYKEIPVPQETLLKIIDIAHYAPSAINKQPVRWVIYDERSKVLRLGEIVAQAMTNFATHNPKDPFSPMAKALVKSWESGNDPFFRGAPQLAAAIVPNIEQWQYGITDAVIALTYLEIAAASHGVGACWAGYFTRMCAYYPPLREAVGAEENEVVAGAQMLGFLKIQPHRIPPRNDAPIEWP